VIHAFIYEICHTKTTCYRLLYEGLHQNGGSTYFFF
jgi:hypothetical protein